MTISSITRIKQREKRNERLKAHINKIKTIYFAQTAYGIDSSFIHPSPPLVQLSPAGSVSISFIIWSKLPKVLDPF